MKKRILVAPLNWGIGHACRCIPIINALINLNFEVVIASDTESLLLLQKEFPLLEFLELPAYNISYAEKRSNFKSHLLKQIPKIYKTIKAEHKATQEIIKTYKIDGIISDNRLGVYSSLIPSVFITHQINVLTGNTTYISSKIHAHFIKKFNTCWIPDFENKPNLSGKMSHFSTKRKPIITTKYIGTLSRFTERNLPIKYDVLVILSGPEPQRSILEEKLFIELKKSTLKILFVKGNVEEKQIFTKENTINIYNYLTTDTLNEAINESELVICRSGYSTIMDLAKLQKKAFFIPTPGQFEQEYLAEHLERLKIAPFVNQEDFILEKLKMADNYTGFVSPVFNRELDLNIFDCFI